MFPLKDTIPTRRPPIATWFLIATNVIVFLFELTLPQPAQEAFFYIFGVVPAYFSGMAGAGPPHGYWALLTSMFLHGGWLHLIGNMWALWIFGKSVEGRLGSLRFVVFYVLCGIAAEVTHVLLQPAARVPAVGASGAISGVMGAYLLMFPTARIIAVFPIFFLPFFFELPAVVFLGLWFLVQFLGAASSALVPAQGGVAWWAHVGGFLFGMGTYRLFQPRGVRRFALPESPMQEAWGRPRWL
jgi:membrane associated rhomboid family serine protease